MIKHSDKLKMCYMNLIPFPARLTVDIGVKLKGRCSIAVRVEFMARQVPSQHTGGKCYTMTFLLRFCPIHV